MAFDEWLERYDDKYPKATACLARDRDELLAFYDFPAAHWTHLRTTNVIESAFATIRHRSSRAKGCVTRQTMLSMIYKMGRCAEKSWRRLRGFRRARKARVACGFVDRAHKSTGKFNAYGIELIEGQYIVGPLHGQPAVKAPDQLPIANRWPTPRHSSPLASARIFGECLVENNRFHQGLDRGNVLKIGKGDRIWWGFPSLGPVVVLVANVSACLAQRENSGRVRP